MDAGHVWTSIVAISFVASSCAASPIPVPPPQITELFFNVPAGEGPAADANKDGTRDAAGDEFIEIANPHNQPINLKGYIITNRRADPATDSGRGVRFVFPDFELPAHGVCVVFNGYQSTAIPPPVGDEAAAPKEGGNAQFNGVVVFSMKITAKSTAFANGGDWVLLTAPDGSPIDCISWGEPSPAPPANALRLQQVDEHTKGSVQRLTPDGKLEPHSDIDNQPFSPGIIPKRTKPLKPAPGSPGTPAAPAKPMTKPNSKP
jgi:hypothetical protein